MGLEQAQITGIMGGGVDSHKNFNIKRMCDLIWWLLIDGTVQYCDNDDDDRRNNKSPRMSLHDHARAAAGINFVQL